MENNPYVVEVRAGKQVLFGHGDITIKRHGISDESLRSCGVMIRALVKAGNYRKGKSATVLPNLHAYVYDGYLGRRTKYLWAKSDASGNVRYELALSFALLPAEQKKQVLAKIGQAIKELACVCK